MTVSIINLVIGVLLAIGVGSVIVVYNKLKNILLVLGALLLLVGNALADDKITDEEWAEIVEKANELWDIITGGTNKLVEKNVIRKLKGRR